MKTKATDEFQFWSESTKAGLKLFFMGDHYKTIPTIYLEVWRKVDLNTAKNQKRLSEDERKDLDKEYFQLVYSEFLSELQKNEKYVFELIENAKVVNTQKVETKTETRNELIFDNGAKVRCSAKLYSLFPEKLDLRYSNY